MSRRFIRQSDKTDRSGAVIDGIAGTSFQGQPFSYLGATRSVSGLRHNYFKGKKVDE